MQTVLLHLNTFLVATFQSGYSEATCTNQRVHPRLWEKAFKMAKLKENKAMANTTTNLPNLTIFILTQVAIETSKKSLKIVQKSQYPRQQWTIN